MYSGGGQPPEEGRVTPTDGEDGSSPAAPL